MTPKEALRNNLFNGKPTSTPPVAPHTQNYNTIMNQLNSMQTQLNPYINQANVNAQRVSDVVNNTGIFSKNPYQNNVTPLSPEKNRALAQTQQLKNTQGLMAQNLWLTAYDKLKNLPQAMNFPFIPPQPLSQSPQQNILASALLGQRPIAPITMPI